MSVRESRFTENGRESSRIVYGAAAPGDFGATVMSLDEAIQTMGVGRVQWAMCIIAGLCFGADGSEVSLLSYMTEVLKHDWKLTETQEVWIASSVFIGIVIGSPVWGCIADKVGRKPSFVLTSLMICVAGFGSCLCQDFVSFMIVRSCVGFGVGGLPVAFDLLTEALPMERRGSFGLYVEFFWAGSSVYVNFIAWMVLESSGWQLYAALAALPTLLSFIGGVLVLTESPMWLMGVGREEEAVEIVNDWARRNRCDLRVDALEVKEKKTSSGDICKPRYLLRALGSTVIWTCWGIAYYGVVMLLPRIFETKSEDTSEQAGKVDFKFGDLLLASFSEFLGVATAICAVDRVGRVKVQFVVYMICGAGFVALGFTNLGVNALCVAAFVTRYAAMAGSCTTYLHAPELFPTHIRGQTHTFFNLANKLGAAAAQFFISDAMEMWTCVGIFASLSVLAAFTALCLPETAGNSMEDLEGDAASTVEGESSERSGSSDGWSE